MTSYVEKFLRIKEIINTNTFPFDYNPNIWNDVLNCYAYALNSLYPEKSAFNTIYYVGAFSVYERIINYSIQDLTERLYADFDVLGLKIRKSSLYEVVPKHCYKICFLSSGHDFHFFRYDKQGCWSHKQGWYNVPTNKYNGKLIIDPNIAKGNYNIIYYYIISK